MIASLQKSNTAGGAAIWRRRDVQKVTVAANDTAPTPLHLRAGRGLGALLDRSLMLRGVRAARLR